MADVTHRYSLALAMKGIGVRRAIDEAQRRERWSEDQIQEYRADRLGKLLGVARNRFDFYRSRLPDDMTSDPMEALHRIPLLTKDDLRGPLAQEGFRRRRGSGILKTTGGSTGQPVRLLKDREGLTQELGAQWRTYAWHGVTPRDRQARFWSAPRIASRKVRASLVDWAANRTTFSAIGLSEATWEQYLNRFRRFRPIYLYGYVSMIRDFVRFLERRDLVVPVPLKVVITTAELLDASSRHEISMALGTPVRSEYGCGEVGVIASECEEGSLHIMSDNLIVEVLDDRGSLIEEGTGEIVVTDLFNYSMPLIRYRLGDIVTATSTRCPCGRPFPVLESVVGRAYDAIRTPDGRTFYGALITGLFASLTERGFRIDGYQVEQETETDVVVRVIPGRENLGSLRVEMTSYLQRHLGPEVAVRVVEVTSIPREPSGKARVVKSAVYPGP